MHSENGIGLWKYGKVSTLAIKTHTSIYKSVSEDSENILRPSI